MPKLSGSATTSRSCTAASDRFLLWDGMAAAALAARRSSAFRTPIGRCCSTFIAKTGRDALLDCAGLDRAKLPRCLPAGTVAGEVAAETAAELGLPPGVKVVVGGHDQCCNALGAGIAAARPGRGRHRHLRVHHARLHRIPQRTPCWPPA